MKQASKNPIVIGAVLVAFALLLTGIIVAVASGSDASATNLNDVEAVSKSELRDLADEHEDLADDAADAWDDLDEDDQDGICDVYNDTDLTAWDVAEEMIPGATQLDDEVDALAVTILDECDED